MNLKRLNFFSIVNAFGGFPIKDARAEYERVRNVSPIAFHEEGERRRCEIFTYHATNNAFYQTLISGKHIRTWEDIPLVQKADFQRPLSEILSVGYNLKSVYKNNTSGSTGKPFHFAKDKFSHALTWVGIVHRYRSIGLEYGHSLQARFFGIPLTPRKYVREKLKDVFSARVRFPVFNLSDQQLELYLHKFYVTRFEYIYGYTSSLVLFAQFLISRGVLLQAVCPSLKWCIVTSEVCSWDDRQTLERAFGVKVINEYGAAELDIIAFEDKDGDWVLNEENLYIEIIGEDGRPVKDGDEGTVVVTSLYNRAMPFIRYNLGDVLSVWPERKGSYRKIKSMQGRTNDVAILPSGKKSPGLTFYYVSKSLLEQGGFLKEFTIKQLAANHFHFEYVAAHELTDRQKIQVQEMMTLYLEPNLEATFERKDSIERTGSGKFKHFQYLVGKSG